ncbi:hypothetical protein ACJJTC_019444 [Scirpophaga incertulas]
MAAQLLRAPTSGDDALSAVCGRVFSSAKEENEVSKKRTMTKSTCLCLSSLDDIPLEKGILTHNQINDAYTCSIYSKHEYTRRTQACDSEFTRAAFHSRRQMADVSDALRSAPPGSRA